jgi:hypothetical protein
MKKQIVVFSSFLIAAALLIGAVSCSKDEDDKVTFALSSLKAGSIDLNGATSPNNVPTDPTIVATFNMSVKASTANSTNITMTRDYDDTAIALTITVSGSSITIVPIESLGNGALFELKMTGIQSTDDQSLAAITRAFTTDGSFLPVGQIAYWSFEENANDVVGAWDPTAAGIVDITYADGRNAAAGKAASFNGTTSIIEIPNGDLLMETADFTLSFWAKADDIGHGHFIVGLGAFYGFQFELAADFKWCKMPVQYDYGDGTSGTGGDLQYNGDGLTLDNGGWKGTTFSKPDDALDATLKEKWFHITYVYNSVSKERSMFLNGELVKTQDHDLWFDDNNEPMPETGIVGLKYAGVAPEVLNELAFGFVQSRGGTLWDSEPWGGYDLPGANHFGGLLDDVRIFHKPLTAQEIELMYESEKP